MLAFAFSFPRRVLFAEWANISSRRARSRGLSARKVHRGFEQSPPLSDRTLFYKYLFSFESIGGRGPGYHAPSLSDSSFSSSPADPPRPLTLTGFRPLFLLSISFLLDPPRLLTGFCTDSLPLVGFFAALWKLSQSFGRSQRAVFVPANLLYVFRTRICIRNRSRRCPSLLVLCTGTPGSASVFDVGRWWRPVDSDERWLILGLSSLGLLDGSIARVYVRLSNSDIVFKMEGKRVWIFLYHSRGGFVRVLWINLLVDGPSLKYRQQFFLHSIKRNV